VSLDDRVDGQVATDVWRGPTSFTTSRARLRVRSSVNQAGLVLVAWTGIQTASRSTPMNLWAAGDTGHAREGLLRAHPVLDEGRLRVERLGRTFIHGSMEAQRWWRVAGPIRVAAAAFADVGRTARRAARDAQGDADVGMGGRFAVTAMPGIFRLDLARGLRDGAIGMSLVYEP
jgi:hypothetical protein